MSYLPFLSMPVIILLEGFMTTAFDYKGFAKDLTKQAEGSMPDDIASAHKKEFLDRIYDFTYIAGEAFSKDETIENSETKKMLTQLISEWTFHKYIDLLRSDIPAMYHESILQKLGYVAYEMGRESALGNLTTFEMLNLVEMQLKKAFEKACSNLVKNGQITQEVYDSAMKQSNVDSMSFDINNVNAKTRSTFKYTICALCFALFTAFANVFWYDFIHLDILNTFSIVVLSMYIGFYIGVKTSSK